MNYYIRRVLKKNMQKWVPESSPRPPFNLVNNPKCNQCTQETLLLYISKEDYQKSLKTSFWFWDQSHVDIIMQNKGTRFLPVPFQVAEMCRSCLFLCFK